MCAWQHLGWPGSLAAFIGEIIYWRHDKPRVLISVIGKINIFSYLVCGIWNFHLGFKLQKIKSWLEINSGQHVCKTLYSVSHARKLNMCSISCLSVLGWCFWNFWYSCHWFWICCNQVAL
jgi:hypothetical protein